MPILTDRFNPRREGRWVTIFQNCLTSPKGIPLGDSVQINAVEKVFKKTLVLPISFTLTLT
jgi:hypothetical protein